MTDEPMQEPTAAPADATDGAADAGTLEADVVRAIEAIVLVATDPVPSEQLAQLLELPLVTVEQLCRGLADAYDEAGHGFQLVKVAGGWRLQSHPDMSPYVERFLLDGQRARMSGAALETLAIVAYKQPISRAQIASIRGVDPDGVLRTLAARGYVAQVAIDPGPGQAALFGTTPQFLEKLGLNSLSDLPPLAEFVPAAEVVEALEHGLRAPDADPKLLRAHTPELPAPGEDHVGPHADSAGPQPSGGETNGTASSGAEPAGTAPNGANSTGAAPNGATPSGTDLAGAGPNASEPAGGEPSGAAPSGAEPVGTAPSAADSAGAAPNGAELEPASGAAPNRAEPAEAEQNGANSAGAEPSGPDSAGAALNGTQPEPDGAVASGTEPRGPAPSGPDSAGAAQNGGEPEGANWAGAAQNGEEPDGANSAGAAQNGGEPSGPEPRGLDSAGAEPSGPEPSGADSSGPAPNGAETAPEPSGPEPT